MADLERNKEVVRRHLEEGVTRRRAQIWSELMTDEFTLHHPLVQPGREGYEEALAALWSAFPDLAIEVLDVVAEGDSVVVRYVERGTHEGDLLGVPPTGRRYEKHGFTLYRLERGRLAEAWLQEDDQGFNAQLFG